MQDSGRRRAAGAARRQLRYNVACSLDGFIADPEGGYDWIVDDQSIDFDALYAGFDTFVMGRKTWAVMQAQGEANPLRGKRVIVASRTLAASEGVTVVRDGIETAVAALKAEASALDIWLFGGSELAGSLFAAGLVDRVEAAVMPVLLTRGIPLLPPGATQKLALVSSQSLASGIQMLAYDVVR
ncbi:MAG TPA: dihydrofolate reductase family protein [Roseateles sp.]|uniref:dihydrofolate reductase family protein n=1 Tax=Roseateles sp. TaxID=1971397 RepID=UPI002ED93491